MMKKSVARYGVLISLAFIFSYVETLIPFEMIGIPGIKLGLANLAVLMALYLFGAKEACMLTLTRAVISGFLFGSLSMILYRFSASLLTGIAF